MSIAGTQFQRNEKKNVKNSIRVRLNSRSSVVREEKGDVQLLSQYVTLTLPLFGNRHS